METKKNNENEQLQQPLDENELDQVTGGFNPWASGNNERDTGDDNGSDVSKDPNGHINNDHTPTRTPYFG